MKPGIRDLLWMASGAAMFLVGSWAVLHVRGEPDAAEQLAARARNTELVDRMRVALASASEYEMAAVLAVTDADSQRFADAARAAIAVLDEGRQELTGLLEPRGTADERKLLVPFSQALDAVRHIDDEVLALALGKTNTKAYALAYGPASQAAEELGDALTQLVAGPGGATQDPRVASLALGAEAAALKVQTLLSPHIAEADDGTMDAIEARMTEQEQEVQRCLEGLASLPQVGSRPELQAATSAWSKFREVKAQVLALSRENTNVRSLAISQHERRDAVLACQGALDALRQAISAEPVAGITYGRPAKPR